MSVLSCMGMGLILDVETLQEYFGVNVGVLKGSGFFWGIDAYVLYDSLGGILASLVLESYELVYW